MSCVLEVFAATFTDKIVVDAGVMLSITADEDDSVVVIGIASIVVSQLRYKVVVGTSILVAENSVIVLLVQVVLASNVVVK